MDKQSAISAMRRGKILTHKYFTDDEFIYMSGDHVLDEQDLVLYGFWEMRKSSEFQLGWSIYKPK